MKISITHFSPCIWNRAILLIPSIHLNPSEGHRGFKIPWPLFSTSSFQTSFFHITSLKCFWKQNYTAGVPFSYNTVRSKISTKECWLRLILDKNSLLERWWLRWYWKAALMTEGKGHVRGQNMKREHNWPGEALQVLCSGQNGMKASKLLMCNSLRDPDLSSGSHLFYTNFILTWRLIKETYGFDTAVLVTHRAVLCIKMIFPAGLMFQETPWWVKSHDSSENSIKTIC